MSSSLNIICKLVSSSSQAWTFYFCRQAKLEHSLLDKAWLIYNLRLLLALCYPFGFLYFFASLHACLHVHTWVCVLSILQSNGTMNTWSKPTFVLLRHPLFLDNMLVCPFICRPYPIWLSLLVCSLHALPISFVSFFACLLVCFFCLCMYTYGAWTLGVRVRPPRCKQKGQGYKRKDASPRWAIFCRLGALALLEWFSLSPSP